MSGITRRGIRIDELIWRRDTRERYDPVNDRWCREIKVAGYWFDLEADPSRSEKDNFIGVFDLVGIGIPTVIGQNPYYAVRNGAGTWRSIDALGGGMRVTTGAVAGNNNLLTNGDNAGVVHPWNVSEEINAHIHSRIPNPADLVQVESFCGLYLDVNNYIGLRYVAGAAAAQLEFVTRSGGVETVTELEIPDNEWSECWGRFTTDQCILAHDGVAYIHTTNIPAGNLTFRNFVETQENVVKNYDLAHLMILQNDI